MNPYTKSSSYQRFAVVRISHSDILVVSRRHTGDPATIHPFLAEIGKDKRKSSEGALDTGAAALHLAIRCGTGAYDDLRCGECNLIIFLQRRPSACFCRTAQYLRTASTHQAPEPPPYISLHRWQEPISSTSC